MADKPILFSAPMVRALIDGRKTQTRRVLPPVHPKFHEFDNLSMDVMIFDPEKPEAWYWDGVHDGVGASYGIRCAVGDRLWVREAHSFPQAWADSPNCAHLGHVFYPASSKSPPPSTWLREKPSDHTRLRPSIHMPRWASRLTLIVTDVRVQRLQEISNNDAIAEGIEPKGHAFTGYGDQADILMAPYESLKSLWNSINGPEAWDANPWVAAYSFRVIRANIDSKEAA